ncbi:hypothetical protein JD79_01719 [Geodermatophilus normandii]|uniref:Uncharacterized protein n=1 Tax=Geodermatophilus normandii TaxID=1137989 RepID=A0A317QIB6_9ACTN|nr:hypothetical protein [Geodermatophilus normandii]PWW22561.1 hypothetical protein JD79_01719 [Geodermatophilus normandii]
MGEITLPRSESQVLLEVQEEQLEQLHVQTELLQSMRKHTKLVYSVLLVALIVSVIGSVFDLVQAVDAANRY